MVEQTQTYYRAKFMCIEQAASGQSLIQLIERETQIHVHKFKPLKSKTIRLQTVAPLFEAGRIHFIDGAWTDSFFKEITSFPHVPHDDWTDAVVWGATYYMFHMEGGGGDYADAFARQGFRKTGRNNLFSEFTELSKEHNSRSRGRNSLFSRGNAGDAYRLGNGEGSSLRRSNDLKFDNPL